MFTKRNDHHEKMDSTMGRQGRRGGVGTQSYRGVLTFVATLVVGLAGAETSYGQLINEVIPANSTQSPVDVEGDHADIVEIFNDTDETLVLGTAVPSDSYALTDTETFPAEDPEMALIFPRGRATIPPNSRILVFCDGDPLAGDCELHAPFNIASDGSEPLVLWGPEDDEGHREIVDRVYLPPLPTDVSWGRFEDGSGGPNLTVEEHLEHFVYYPPGRTSFGSCVGIGVPCLLPGGGIRRQCSGAPNRAPRPDEDNLPPSLSRVGESTNVPGDMEPVEFTVRVRDDQMPNDENIASVEIVYRVDPDGSGFGDEEHVAMTIDADVGDNGVLSFADRGRPLDFYSHWEGAIEGQPAGSRVEFFFRVTDQQGLTTTRPRRLCHMGPYGFDGDWPYSDGDGPCDREFGPEENGCARDEDDRTCEREDPDRPGTIIFDEGERYISCSVRSHYKVAHTPTPEKASIVINEVVPAQTNLLEDRTELGIACNSERDACLLLPDAEPNCCRTDEDFIELHNSSDEPVDMSGCFLSDSFFQPRGWKFPEGSVIPAGAYVIVWLDRDGGRCPDEDREDPPCFWECPDPNTESMAFEDGPEFHASFAIDADGDQIFLYDTEENGLGLIHGVDFGTPSEMCGFTPGVNSMGEPTTDVRPNQSIVLLPDGDPNGQFVIVSKPSVGSANEGEICEIPFRRGDVTNAGAIDLSDGVRILNFLFLGGEAPTCFDAADTDDNGAVELSDAVGIFSFLFLGGTPPAEPGAESCGGDPTDDTLPECVYTADC